MSDIVTFKEPTCERFVAYFDIMGFKDRIYRDGHDNVLKLMENLQEKVKQIKSAGEKAITYQQKSGEDVPDGSFGEIASMLRILPVFFSDSILLVSEDGSEECARGIIATSTFLIEYALVRGIPLKGAVAYGKQTADFIKSLHFGRPLVDAYLLAEELQLYGAVLHHTMESYLKEHELEKIKMIDDMVNNVHVLSKCKIPLKEGSVNHYCLTWWDATVPHEFKPHEIVSRLYDTVSGSTRHYVDNTLDVVNAIENDKPKK